MSAVYTRHTHRQDLEKNQPVAPPGSSPARLGTGGRWVGGGSGDVEGDATQEWICYLAANESSRGGFA